MAKFNLQSIRFSQRGSAWVGQARGGAWSGCILCGGGYVYMSYSPGANVIARPLRRGVYTLHECRAACRLWPSYQADETGMCIVRSGQLAAIARNQEA
jgi:hypothetical protein